MNTPVDEETRASPLQAPSNLENTIITDHPAWCDHETLFSMWEDLGGMLRAAQDQSALNEAGFDSVASDMATRILTNPYLHPFVAINIRHLISQATDDVPSPMSDVADGQSVIADAIELPEPSDPDDPAERPDARTAAFMALWSGYKMCAHQFDKLANTLNPTAGPDPLLQNVQRDLQHQPEAYGKEGARLLGETDLAATLSLIDQHAHLSTTNPDLLQELDARLVIHGSVDPMSAEEIRERARLLAATLQTIPRTDWSVLFPTKAFSSSAVSQGSRRSSRPASPLVFVSRPGTPSDVEDIERRAETVEDDGWGFMR
jgi:hypothetical protein